MNAQQKATSFELRSFSVSEIRAANDDSGKPKITGHAAVYNSLSEDLGGFREIIAMGAFTKTLKDADVRGLWNHDPNIVLGRNKSGTLRLHEDDKGLAFELDPPDTQLVRDMVMTPIGRGDVSQCSFRFRTITDKWEKQGGIWVRTLVEVDISDVSIVTYPAYSATDASVRSIDVALRSLQAVIGAPDSNYIHDLRKKKLALAC